MKIPSFLILIAATAGVAFYAQSQYEIEIKDASSLVRVGMDPHPKDSADIALAYTLIGAFDHCNPDSIKFVEEIWRSKANNNRTKDKAYSTLSYILSRYLNESYEASDSVDIKTSLTNDLYHYFTDNDFENLRKYLTLKYELNNYRPRSVKEFIEQRTFYEDFLMFNDPDRNSWDCTEEVMQLLPLKEGDKVADIGCGFGYNAVRLKEKIGDSGCVYATDTESNYVNYLKDFIHKNNISGIVPIKSQSNDISVPDTLDMVFMSSLYHIIYTWSRED